MKTTVLSVVSRETRVSLTSKFYRSFSDLVLLAKSSRIIALKLSHLFYGSFSSSFLSCLYYIVGYITYEHLHQSLPLSTMVIIPKTRNLSTLTWDIHSVFESCRAFTSTWTTFVPSFELNIFLPYKLLFHPLSAFMFICKHRLRICRYTVYVYSNNRKTDKARRCTMTEAKNTHTKLRNTNWLHHSLF